MNSSFINLIVIQFKAFFREPAIIFWALIFPLAIAGVLGIAFHQGEDLIRTVAIIKSESALESERLEQLKTSADTDPKNESAPFNFYYTTYDSAELLLKRGEVSLIIEVKSNDSLIFNFDPQNAEGQLTALMLENKLLKKAQPDSVTISPITAQGNRYIDFLIPGLIALGIMNSCIWGIGWNLIEFRIKKLMRRMVATPMKRSYFLLGHIISRAVLSTIEAGLLFTFAYFVFGVTMQGSFLALAIIFLAGIMAFAGISVIASARATSTQEGNGIINAIVLPMTILSGIFFSYRSFPDWAVAIIEKLPLTMLSDGIRAVFNEGATLQDIGGQIIGLVLTGIIFFALGLRIYKWY